MAVSSSSYFSFAINGVPQVGGGINLFAADASPKFVLGTKYERADGSIFHYAHFGAACNSGILVSQDLSESSRTIIANSVIASASASAVPGESISAGKVGSRYVEASVPDATADQFAGGYMALTSDSGAGFIYPIIGNTAEGNPSTGHCRIELQTPLKSALDATSDFALVGSRWANLEGATAATDCDVAGVTVAYQTAGTFGWVQTQGRAVVLADCSGGNMAVGDLVALSDGTTGAAQTAGGGSESANAEIVAEQILGYCVIAPIVATASSCAVIQLQME